MARFAGIQLEPLRIMTNAFLELATSLGRPLLTSERRCFAWLLLEWESPTIHSAFNQMSKHDPRLGYYTRLIAQLREVIIPDPIRQIHLQRVRQEHVAEKHDGNHATVTELFEGLSVRRLSLKDVLERLQLLNRLTGSIYSLVNELAMVRNRDRDEAREISTTARKLVKQTRIFAEHCEQSPAPSPVPSLEESLENMRIMNGLMIEAVAV